MARPQSPTATHRNAYWIPGIIIGAMLLVVAVNGVMVFFATSTFPGLDNTKAYVNGLAYNETLREAAASNNLAWQAHATIDAQGNISVQIHDKVGEPLSGLTLRGQLLRTTTTAMDRPLTFAAGATSGHYQAKTDLPAPGLWELRVAAPVPGQDIVWQWHDRIMVP